MTRSKLYEMRKKPISINKTLIGTQQTELLDNPVFSRNIFKICIKKLIDKAYYFVQDYISFNL